MSTLYVDNLQPNLGNAVYAAGHVIQVVSLPLAANAAINSTSEIPVLNLSITPNFSTSKILLLCNWSIYLNGGASEERGDIIFKRGSTFIGGSSSSASGTGYFRDSSGRIKAFTTSFHLLDSPATTSSTTYSMRYDGFTNNVGGEFQSTNTTMTLMEIAQ